MLRFYCLIDRRVEKLLGELETEVKEVERKEQLNENVAKSDSELIEAMEKTLQKKNMLPSRDQVSA